MSVSYRYRMNQLEAFSTESGITVSSRAFSDIPKMCVSVNYDENGKMQKTVHNESIRVASNKYYEEHPSRKKDVDVYSGSVCILVAILYHVVCSIVHTKFFITCAIFSFISICLTNALVNFGSYIGNIVYMIKHPSLSRFHSAEHMAVLAYHKKEKVPSMKEIKQTSRFDTGCSQVESLLVPFVTSLIDSIILTVAIIVVHFGIITALDQLFDTSWFVIVLPVFVFYYEANEKLVSFINSLIKRLFEHEFIVKFFQWSLLRKPTYKELILAREALRQREILDKRIKEHANEYKTESVFFNPKENKTMYVLENGEYLCTTIDEYLAWIESYKNAEVIESDDDQDDTRTDAQDEK